MNKTIVALDFPNKTNAIEFLKNFDKPIFVKVGMELFYAEGNSLLKEIKEMGHNIFLDLKLHDIPNTVKSAMRVLSNQDVDMINVHCSGGVKMMKEAVSAISENTNGKKRPLIIGVTQLTSTSKEVMNEELCIAGEVEDIVIKYALNAKNAGLDGVVCSVHEVKKIHQVCGDDFLTVTPGIRLESDDNNDQVRVATPKYAKECGSDYIVVGRSITSSDKPEEVYYNIEEILRG